MVIICTVDTPKNKERNSSPLTKRYGKKKLNVICRSMIDGKSRFAVFNWHRNVRSAAGLFLLWVNGGSPPTS